MQIIIYFEQRMCFCFRVETPCQKLAFVLALSQDLYQNKINVTRLMTVNYQNKAISIAFTYVHFPIIFSLRGVFRVLEY